MQIFAFSQAKGLYSLLAYGLSKQLACSPRNVRGEKKAPAPVPAVGTRGSRPWSPLMDGVPSPTQVKLIVREIKKAITNKVPVKVWITNSGVYSINNKYYLVSELYVIIGNKEYRFYEKIPHRSTLWLSNYTNGRLQKVFNILRLIVLIKGKNKAETWENHICGRHTYGVSYYP